MAEPSGSDAQLAVVRCTKFVRALMRRKSAVQDAVSRCDGMTVEEFARAWIVGHSVSIAGYAVTSQLLAERLDSIRCRCKNVACPKVCTKLEVLSWYN